ncbi:hypothetical protein GCM10010329_44040 [Streptomyces spiroverticillatus]|uniref:Peptidase inhibitor family I36 protein n=1 Tax=Streptomyces finlayi TaxID=67296 RepID=A0A918WZU8_9ACTN|nr:hypothetical protein [Streptomyces finlayi]GHA16359.1 hypothetical protein GCM10010329_44040 [Streptomyces spiroverticillatus]GHC98631.1 hypothetical protein GCM10010334_41220 [Streptomyces finlayi]
MSARLRLPAALLAAAALLVAVPSATAQPVLRTPSASAAPAAPAALPGYVCFWSEPEEHGAGGGWCYNGTGYSEAEPRVKRHAKSFSNQTQDTFYALHFLRDGGCLYRTIYGGDYSPNWEWWEKFDGVQRSRPADCQPG